MVRARLYASPALTREELAELERATERAFGLWPGAARIRQETRSDDAEDDA